MSLLYSPAMFLAMSTYQQLRRALLDNTFTGIHQLDWFDLAMLIPYFTLLGILSLYGLHRYEMIRNYFKYRKKLPKEPPVRFEHLPRVTIQFPLYNERYVVERLMDEVTKIEYPRELLQIQVLDDSTDETHSFTGRCARLSGSGHPDRISSSSQSARIQGGRPARRHEDRDRRVRSRFSTLISFRRRDFLKRTVHHFADPKWAWCKPAGRTSIAHYNLLTEVEAILLDGHFVIEHGARSGSGLFFNFNGTAGILRAAMIDDAGGWQHDTLTEDSDLSYRAQLKGWRFVYLPEIECPSELPVEMYGFQVQQSRWAKGLTQVAMKLLPSILRADIPVRAKVEAIFHLTPNISYPLMMVVSALTLPVMIVRFYMGWLQMVTIDLPLIIASFWSISAFYLMSQRELFPKSWKRTVF